VDRFNMLKITGYGRKAALDMRLVNPIVTASDRLDLRGVVCVAQRRNAQLHEA
jgi:hypothetical protein